MGYTPKTEEQLAEEALMPEGIYDFEVIDTDDRPSKKGNSMFTLKLCVFDDDGRQRFIYDYMAMGNTFGERKLRHAARSCGLLDCYNSANMVPSDFMGASGKALIKRQDGTTEYPSPKNVVSDYIDKDYSNEITNSATKSSKDLIDDDIPF
jgi:hypothetical protein